jgi:hypothetical protein
MNIVARTAKKSPRLFAIALLIALVSTFVMASQWQSVKAFALSYGEKAQAEQSANRLLEQNYKPDAFLTPGTCDSGNLIDVEATVGSAPGGFASLKGAFDAVNAGTVGGVVTIEVCGDTTETVSAVLNASGSGSASYTSITIQPVGGSARTISGAIVAGSPLIDFNGADNVTVNGLNAGGNSLTISNTTASATSGTSTIRFIGGATNNTITNSTILGSHAASVATNGATIFFSTDANTANGNDNNTISNNNIGPAGANLPTKAILGNGSTTTQAIGNSGIIIDNNNIFDYFGAAVTSSGIATNGGCNTWTITNNRLYQTGARTWTTGSLHVGIDIRPTTATSGAQGFTITGNTIGYASNTQTGTYTLTGAGTGAKFTGILFNGIVAGATTNVNNNTVAAVSMTGVTSGGTTTASPFTGILFQEGNGITNGNTIGSQSATGSLTFSTTTTSATDVFGILNFSSNVWTSNNNNIGGISVTNLGASGTFQLIGMRGFTVSTTTWTANSNIIGGTVANSIQLNATGTSSQVIGLAATTAPSLFTSNTIRNLTSNIGTGTTTGASVIGINVSTATPNHTLSQNTIFNLSNTNATAASVVTGIQFTGATANVVERNLIHSLTVATNSATAEVNGIRVGGGTTTYRNNMIAIGAGIANAIGAAATNAGTTGINGINEPLGTDNFYHNSVYIGGSPTVGTAASYAFNSTQTTGTRAFRDNIFFNARSNSGATGKNYAVKINGTTANPTGLTINNNVYFANGSGGVFGFFNSADVANIAAWRTAVGQDANSFESNPQYLDPTNATPDLHLNPSVATVAEANGADVGVTNDFDGQTRASLTPVDIGADAGNFMGIDLAAPSISYAALGNTSQTTNRTLSVNITDATGVATGGFVPRIYFNKNAGTYVSTACSLSSGTTQNGVWDCTIDHSLLGGVVAADVIRYFVVAQDTLGNLAANPSGGFSGTNVNSVTTPPTTPNQYSISTAFTGSFNVGTGETYTSLTNAGGIFEALNNGVLSGNVTINITTDLTGELGTVALNQFSEDGTGGYTLLIKPSGAARSITGSSTSSLIKLNGADRVRIDGSTAASFEENVVGGDPLLRELTITNTGTGAVVWIATNATSGANNNTIKNTILIGAGAFTGQGIITGSGATFGAAAESGRPNSNNTIQNNRISRVQNAAFISGDPTTRDQNWSITENDLGSTTVADKLSFRGMLISGADNFTISQNRISGVLSSTATSSTMSGIQVAGIVSGGSITRNEIKDIKQVNTTGWGSNGIYLAATSTASNLLIANNMISDIASQGFNGNEPADNGYGIVVEGTGGGYNIYNNTVVINGNEVTAGITAALLIDDSATTVGAVNLRNNILANTQTVGANYSVFVDTPVTNTVFSAIDYNDYFTTENVGSLGGTNRVALADWQTATGSDVNSKSVDPVFVSTTDFHLQASSTLLGMGTPIASVTNDFDGQTRDAIPDIGADEIVTAAPAGTVQFSSATYSVGEGGGTATLTITRTGGSSGAVTVNYSLGGGTATGGAACGGPVDYVNTSGSVMFADGDAADKTFNVAICDDPTFETPNETFDATLSIGSGSATLGTPNLATVTITENDAQPSLQFTFASYSVGEGGGNAVISVTRTGATGNAVSVNYATVAGGTATGGASCGGSVDYVNTSGTLNFASGITSQTFNVPICDDNVYETPSPETVNLSISSPTGGAVLGAQSTAVLDINENDAQPTVQFGFLSGSAGEGLTFSAQVSRTGALGNAIGVSFATSDGTATGGAACTAGVDYITTSGTLSWAANDPAFKAFNVVLCDDSVIESGETINLTLSSPTGGATLGSTSSVVLTITDNDSTVQFSSATYSQSETGPTATITVTRTGTTTGFGATVNYATVAGGTATGGASCGGSVDYVNTSGTLTFTNTGAGNTTQTFTIPICDDALTEPGETVNLQLSTPGPGANITLGSPSTATLTINDNDADTTAPVITYTMIPVNSFNPTLNATITDAVGVTGATIFWKINGGSFTSAGCSLSGGTAQNGTWSCLITGMTNPNAVSYYVTATDAAMNTAANPTGGATSPNLFTFGAATVPAGTYNSVSLGNGVSLGGNVDILSSLNLNGVVNTGANKLTLECPAIVTGGGEFSYVVGNLEKLFCGAGSFTYNVGAAFAGPPPVAPEDTNLAPEGSVSNYSPLTVNILGGTTGSSLTVSATDGFMDGAVQVNSISRYWTLTENGDLTANLAFTYRNEDVVGTESSYKVIKREGGMTSDYPGGTVNAATNTFNAPGVSDFSQWSAGTAVPTAANAEISGRLVTANGEGIRNATVMLMGGTLTQPIYVQTGTFGSYTFRNLPVGQTYLITVISKRYTFANPTRVINLVDSATDEDFVADSQ